MDLVFRASCQPLPRSRTSGVGPWGTEPGPARSLSGKEAASGLLEGRGQEAGGGKLRQGRRRRPARGEGRGEGRPVSARRFNYARRLWAAAGFASSESCSGECFWIDSCGVPQVELLVLLRLIHVSESELARLAPVAGRCGGRPEAVARCLRASWRADGARASCAEEDPPPSGAGGLPRRRSAAHVLPRSVAAGSCERHLGSAGGPAGRGRQLGAHQGGGSVAGLLPGWNGACRRVILTDPVRDVLVAALRMREAAYGASYLEPDCRLARPPGYGADWKLYHCDQLQASERTILRRCERNAMLPYARPPRERKCARASAGSR